MNENEEDIDKKDDVHHVPTPVADIAEAPKEEEASDELKCPIQN